MVRAAGASDRRDAIMNWTNKRPTAPGWYWYRKGEQEEKRLLKLGIVAFSDDMKAIWPSGRSESIIKMSGEWSGPMESDGLPR